MIRDCPRGDEEFIYGLVDPRQPEEYRYIGRTTDCLSDRLSKHYSDSVDQKKKQWLIDVENEAGVRVEIKLIEVTSRQMAGQRELFWIKYHHGKNHRLLNRRLVHTPVPDPARKVTPFERAARTLIASRAAKGTRSGYTSDLAAWLAFCEAEGADPGDPPPDGPSRFRDGLMKRYAAQTVRRTLAALSKMYRAALGARLVTHNPFDGDALPRPPADAYARTEAVPEAVAQRVISATQEDGTPAGVRDLAVLRLLYDTGMRRASVAGLRVADVFIREDRTVVSFQGKGNKRHEATLPVATARAVFEQIAKTDELGLGGAWVFPQETDPRKYIDPSTVNRIITRRAKLAGHPGVHPHQFRSAFITEALDELPLHEVQAAVGHADPRMTLRYDRRRRGGNVADHVAKMREKKGEG